MTSPCIFCRILAGELPCTKVAESANAIAIEDIHPVSPVHVLVIPRRHVDSLEATGADDTAMLGEMLALVRTVAEAKGVSTSGYRVVTNVGRDGGQAVPHLHFHVLGGKRLGPKLGA